MISRNDVESTINGIAYDHERSDERKIALLQFTAEKSVRAIGESHLLPSCRMEARLAIEKVIATANVMVEELKHRI